MAKSLNSFRLKDIKIEDAEYKSLLDLNFKRSLGCVISELTWLKNAMQQVPIK